jgi:multiple sugar transport system substrate-binding protein
MDTRNEDVGATSGMNRRDFLKISGAGLAGASLLGVAGCGGGGGAEQAEDGSTIITFAMAPDDSGTLEKIIQQFNDDHSGEYKVNHRKMPTDTGAFFDQLRTQFQAGGGDIDVIGGDVIWPAQFAANGWITDLSDRFTEDMRSKFLQGPIDSNTYDGAVYGVPWYTDAGMLYYRQDLLEQSGYQNPPETWEELIEMAKKVKQDSGTEDGFVFQGAEYEGGVVDGIEYINSFGGSVLADGKSDEVVIDSPESVAGLSMERRMIEEEVAPKAVTTYTEEETEAAFLNGDAVFARNWPYMYALTQQEDMSNISADQVGVAPLPKGDGGESVSGLGGWNLFINSAADQKTQDGAWEFIQFMVAKEQQKFRAMEGSFLPTLSALYDDQEILDAVPVIALGGEALKRTVPRPVSPYYSDMSLEMAEEFNASLNGDKSPEEAISSLQGDLQNIVDEGSQG